MTRRERGITRLAGRVGMRGGRRGGGRRSLGPRARLVSPSTPLGADRACRCSIPRGRSPRGEPFEPVRSSPFCPSAARSPFSFFFFFATVRIVREFEERWSNNHRHRDGDSWEA